MFKRKKNTNLKKIYIIYLVCYLSSFWTAWRIRDIAFLPKLLSENQHEDERRFHQTLSHEHSFDTGIKRTWEMAFSISET